MPTAKKNTQTQKWSEQQQQQKKQSSNNNEPVEVCKVILKFWNGIAVPIEAPLSEENQLKWP